MAKPDWQSRYWGSPERFDARAKLRAVAKSAAEQTGRDSHDVLRVLVLANARERLADCPGAVAGAVDFEMALHESDQLRELTSEALKILEIDQELD